MSVLNVQTVAQFDDVHISYGFFGRRGGVSRDLYKSLNTGFGAKYDDKDNITENRRRICRHIGVDPAALFTVYQEHGTVCQVLGTPWADEDRPKADALVTDQPLMALGIMTADCAPVLFHGKKANGDSVIGAAHAGWRGALAGVLQETLRQMCGLGAKQETVRACIGPCIQKKSYEVSAAFYQAFMAQSPENEHFFMDGHRDNHPHFDLSGYCAAQLQGAGVERIYIQGTDTYESEAGFFSCRRAAHKNEADYGRQMSVIMIRA
jgi:YfiH family protein